MFQITVNSFQRGAAKLSRRLLDVRLGCHPGHRLLGLVVRLAQGIGRGQEDPQSLESHGIPAKLEAKKDFKGGFRMIFA